MDFDIHASGATVQNVTRELIYENQIDHDTIREMCIEMRTLIQGHIFASQHSEGWDMLCPRKIGMDKNGNGVFPRFSNDRQKSIDNKDMLSKIPLILKTVSRIVSDEKSC